MNLLEVVVRVVAPPLCVGCGREGVALCTACVASEVVPYGERCWNCGALSPGCQACQRCRRLGGPRRLWITTDYSGLPRRLVKVYKFGHQRAAAIPLASLMADSVTCGADELTTQDYLVVPVPTASSRIRQRGFDHAALLAQELAKRMELEYAPLLRRSGQSRQVGASRKDRLARPVGEYSVRFPAKVAGRNILLIDDVITTGGTLIAATKALRAAGAKWVDGLVYAKKL